MSRTRTRSRSAATPAGRHRPSARLRLLACAVAAGTACAGLSAVPASAAEAPPVVSRGVTIPEFYTPPAALPADNGALIRSEALPLGLSIPGLDGRPMPGTATRLMYRSTDSAGMPVAVTGAYIEPSAAWKGSGPRPLVALASGTMGQGDQCAPSFALQYPLTLNGDTVSVGYEALAVYRILATGAAVVVTDYVGLGATDRLHTYVNRLDQGHALLDAARAARSVPGASVTAASRTGLYGYSQGGGASAAAAELQPSYAPDVRLAGTYAGAPPADLTSVMKGIDGSALAGALAWSINGFAQADPDLRAVVEANISSTGKAALADASTMCVGDALLGYGFTRSSKWTTSGKTIGRSSPPSPGPRPPWTGSASERSNRPVPCVWPPASTTTSSRTPRPVNWPSTGAARAATSRMTPSSCRTSATRSSPTISCPSSPTRAMRSAG